MVGWMASNAASRLEVRLVGKKVKRNFCGPAARLGYCAHATSLSLG